MSLCVRVNRWIEAKALLAGCLSFVRWFEKAYDPQEVTYLLDSDLEQADALDDSVAVLIVVGRSEYWSRPMRNTFDRFVDGGGRALLVCSEVMYWQVRLDHSRYQLIRYGEGDPHPDPLLKTTVWHDPSLRYPVYPRTGCELRYGGERSTQEVGWSGMRIVCPESPLLEGLDLAENDVIRLPDATVWDGAPVVSDNGKLIVDFGESVPWRHEVVGYNLVRSGGQRSQDIATSLWIAMRSSPESGTVVHCGTMGWCGAHAIGGCGPDSEHIRTVVMKMIDILRQDVWPFSSRRDQSDDDGPSDGATSPFTVAST